MGDRCNGELIIHGLTDLNSWGEILAAVEEYSDERHAKNHFQFYEMNYGTLPPDIMEELEKYKMSYQWWTEPGGDYPAGVDMYNAQTKQHGSFLAADGEICIPVSHIENEESIAHCLKWHKWICSKPTFTIIDAPSEEFIP